MADAGCPRGHVWVTQWNAKVSVCKNCGADRTVGELPYNDPINVEKCRHEAKASPPLRNPTADEAANLRLRGHELRAADSFSCPRCKTDSGISSSVPEAAVIKCHWCGCEYFAWTVPGAIHVSAKL